VESGGQLKRRLSFREAVMFELRGEEEGRMKVNKVLFFYLRILNMEMERK